MTQVTERTSPSLEAAARLVRRSDRIAVMSHVHPDADAIGSTLGLVHGLRAIGKHVVGALSDRIPEYTRFLAGSGDIVPVLPPDPFDLLICADSADIERLGNLYLQDLVRFETLPIINLDHHRTNPLFGTVNLVDPAASSTSELAFWLLAELGAPLDESAATALLFGIVGDTGSFRNGATTPGSLEVAAHLLRLGADQQAIAFQLFECKRFAAARLWGRILSGIELDAPRRIVFAYVSQDMLREEEATSDEMEGIAEYLRGIVEADVVVLMKETEDGEMRISMRSRPGVDVSVLAADFGGGGHRQAAGCTLPGPPAAAREALTSAFDRLNPR